MKQLFITILVVLGAAMAATVNAKGIKALQAPVTGKVVDTGGNPVAYATVIALQDNVQAAGTTTDDNGAFALALNSGEYTLSFEFLGYKTVEKRVTVIEATELGEIVLEDDNIKIEGVEVTAQIIRREADRFVVDVANMPSAIGKDGVELLQTSPGVFINDDKITINGRSGTKVYVNEREVRYTGDRLLTYLRSLKTEEIQKIEVVPIAGADYDADSSGGIIKITLRQKRDDGFMGSAALRTSINDLRWSLSTSLNLDYRTGKWTLSASGSYGYNNGKQMAEDETVYTGNDNHLLSKSNGKNINDWYNGKFGAIYDLNEHHSLGAEVEYSGYNSNYTTSTYSLFKNAIPPVTDESTGDYSQPSGSQSLSARFNYIVKLDTLGSMFKVLADYTHQRSHGDNNYITTKTTTAGDIVQKRDSLYRDNAGTNYNIASVGVSWDKVFSPKFTLKTGAKYSYNLMESFSNYDYLDNETATWVTRPSYNYDVDYTENIGALYAIAVTKLGRWGITAGLRGEYTNTSGRKNVARQNYFSLFPNANISFALKKDQSYLLVGQYSRTIQRPNFWALNPERQQISEYMYQVGNPYLNPSFNNGVTLSAVMKYKYTISLMAGISTGEIGQIVLSDSEDPKINYVKNENLDRVEYYGASVNLPFQFTKWWSANMNLVGGYIGTRLYPGASQEFHPMINWSASMTFTLPLKFYINVDYWGMGKTYYSNIVINGRNVLNFSVKKRLLKERLSLSAGVNNIVPVKNIFKYSDETFVRRFTNKEAWSRPTFTFSVSYNFDAGKKFNKKAIESDADAGRLAK